MKHDRFDCLAYMAKHNIRVHFTPPKKETSCCKK